jgi:DNA-binding MarR family transcriptional regulator
MEKDLKETIVKFTRLISAAEEDAKRLYEMQDLTAAQFNYLEIIGELGNPTFTELAATMGLTKPSVTTAVDRLMVKGLVRKVQSDSDKRSSHLHLTEFGEQINKRHDYAHDHMIDLIEKKLDGNEVMTFTLLLDKITNI